MTTRKALLIGSLLLNLFLIGGIVAGAAWLRARHPMIAAGALRIAGDELPLAERHAFRVALRQERRDAQPLLLASRAARSEAARLLVQPTVDQTALGAALARARAAEVALRARIEARAVTFVATLPPADRARLAEGLQRPRAVRARR